MKWCKKQSLDKLINEIYEIEPLLTETMLMGVQEIMSDKYPDINYDRILYDKEYAMSNAGFVKDYLKELRIPYFIRLNKSL